MRLQSIMKYVCALSEAWPKHLECCKYKLNSCCALQSKVRENSWCKLCQCAINIKQQGMIHYHEPWALHICLDITVGLTPVSSKEKIQLAKGIVPALHQGARPTTKQAESTLCSGSSKGFGPWHRGRYADLFHGKVSVRMSLSPAGCLCQNITSSTHLKRAACNFNLCTYLCCVHPRGQAKPGSPLPCLITALQAAQMAFLTQASLGPSLPCTTNVTMPIAHYQLHWF